MNKVQIHEGQKFNLCVMKKGNKQNKAIIHPGKWFN